MHIPPERLAVVTRRQFYKGAYFAKIWVNRRCPMEKVTTGSSTNRFEKPSRPSADGGVEVEGHDRKVIGDTTTPAARLSSPSLELRI
jgi:hypothetical protein